MSDAFTEILMGICVAVMTFMDAPMRLLIMGCTFYLGAVIRHSWGAR